MTNAIEQYPVRFTIENKDARDRLTTLFRLFTSIPIMVLYCVFTKLTSIIVFPVLLMVLFQKKYPKWWFDFNLSLSQFSARVMSYFFFLVDEYPSTDQEQRVHLNFDYPDVEKQLNPFLPIIKWFLAIPHYVVLAFLAIVSIVLMVFSWFSILFTGKYPQSFFDFQVGLMRWILRVEAYAFLLITDQYPPFSLK